MKDWKLVIDDDYPGRMLRYRCHLWDSEDKFRGENYVATKWGARLWAWREKRKLTHPSYGKRTVVSL